MPGEESAQAFVCWSCHNGSVVDSRRALTVGGQHPVAVDVERSADKRLRLYGAKRLECGTCHNPHGQRPGAAEWLRLPDDLDAFCLPCHENRNHYHQGTRLAPEVAASVRARGGRVGADGRVGCRTCHTPHGARGPKLLIGSYPGPDSERGLCELCHGDKIVAEKTGERPTPCVDCHEAHLDARLGLKGGPDGPCAGCHGDRKGTEPGEHPVTAKGCGGCHSIHKPVRSERGARPFLRAVNAAALLCQECHADRMGRHGPVAKVSQATRDLVAQKGFGPIPPDGTLGCATCHRSHRAPEPKLLRRPQWLGCLYCHEGQNPYGPAGEAGTHPVGIFLTRDQRAALETPRKDAAAPQEEEADEALYCGACHSSHDAWQSPSAPCAACHPDEAKAPAHTRGGKGCGDCHSVHASTPAALSCKGCHKDRADTLHPPGVAIPAASLPLYDDAGRRRATGQTGCATCHDPHGSGPKRLRTQKPQELCLLCHSAKEGMAKNVHYGAGSAGKADGCLPCHPQHQNPVEEAFFSVEDRAGKPCRDCHGEGRTSLPAHTAQGVPPWKSLSGNLPLFDPMGQRDAMGFVSCPTCHDLHNAGASLRLPARGSAELCLSCHRAYDSILGSAHDPAAKGDDRRCTACHAMHGQGEKPSVWDLQIRGAGTWNDRKCLSCHGAADLESSPHLGKTSHPVNRDVEGRASRLGLPLFDPLGAKGGKRVVCGTCHDIHGARSNDGEVLPDFLRMSPGDGRLCGTCHPEQAAVALTPHDFSATGSSALGTCGPCHTAHRAREEGPLWGLPPAESDWPPNRLCRGCHTMDRRKQDKGPLLQIHMKDADPWLTPRGTIYLQRPMTIWDETAIKRGRPPVIPLFDREGRAGPHGSLQCVSCHEPHRWSPASPDIKPFEGMLSKFPTRFVRFKDFAEASSTVCVECHPSNTGDYLRRYHQVWEDVGAEVNPSLFPRE